ncbi:hypothetical protein K9N08_00070 [Candidatus Gracilibacteria bacterium]|nr:hypothetical protein [Candidatus Gracilibacteria bacterium]MCF7855946.1 hypothetical protein [Candidatus Gracilibacteria bacterium]MCF7896361.1 hypothetical protein [Candidatus Gracilibacteria bacterium]
MPNKNKFNRSTADLIVVHTERHLAQNPHLKAWAYLLNLKKIFSPLLFAFAGIIVMVAAFQIVNLAHFESPAFFSEGATNYTTQKAFYSTDGDAMHSASDEFTAVRMKIREAAIASELSRALNFAGLFLILGGLWYLHKNHNIFSAGRMGFTIRRIR